MDFGNIVEIKMNENYEANINLSVKCKDCGSELQADWTWRETVNLIVVPLKCKDCGSCYTLHIHINQTK